MRFSRTISPLAGLLLIFLFALSISPRKYLHDMFAHHTDQPVTLHSKVVPVLQVKGFQCDQLDVVVDLPFAPAADTLPTLIIPENFFRHKVHYSFREIPGNLFSISLRGPPALPQVVVPSFT